VTPKKKKKNIKNWESWEGEKIRIEKVIGQKKSSTQSKSLL
jgi:hypothetical protein